jgi:VWFA-related protein
MRNTWWHRTAASSVLAVAVSLVLAPSDIDAQQQPTFRSSIDLIAVDVQVVDGRGTPVPSLKAGDFTVSISGKQRRVLTADYVQFTDLTQAAQTLPVMSGPTASNLWPAEPPPVGGAAPPPGRLFVLAFDTDSFSIIESRDVVAAARGFIRRLRPNDKVGIYTFPVGPRREPTIDHAEVSRLVDTVVGRGQQMLGEYNLTPSEIVDITAENARDRSRAVTTAGRGAGPNIAGTPGGQPTVAADSVLQRVQLRECGAADSACAEMIQTEASSKAFYLEGRATEGLNGLRSLIQLLNEQQGRKTVVMFSGGIVAADRPGGRPEVGELAKQLGQDAAATNTAIYTLHIDSQDMQAVRPEQRRTDRTPVAVGRDSAVSGRLLEEFSGASGGAMMRVLMGGGEIFLDRVLRETSSHYLLGVEPADVDRDGKLRELRVRVNMKDTTVRSRSWVVIPKRK